MTTVGSDSVGTAVTFSGDWTRALSVPGPDQDEAMRHLHLLLLRASRTQVLRMRSSLGPVGSDVVEEIVHQAADDAMMALLGKLSSFEGRSRFTTWAYKFAVLHAATHVRRRAWRDRDVHLDALDVVPDRGATSEQYAEAADLADAVRQAIDTVLSQHQRRILLALVVEEIPVDVLADRLGASRNALYKTLHDARRRLRTHLRETGHLADPDQQAGTT
ncbi:MAG: sigma-70 family RNA polymerase sigma factor [Nocardioidaceae bacterium]|nr:sigma-70 family RNA polymerase sigma factor [Nocardioidaceae bacterium]NUS50166.1 sigma-70 family RNA polymerase sigma factor [Nocardioidaceae bacterium]